MRLDDLDLVSGQVFRRKQIIADLEKVMTRADALNLTAGGREQDHAMLALIKPMVIKELSGRISAIDRTLIQLGVDIN